MGTDTTKRPWLAVLLAVVFTGGGHLYLRRWLRALGWIALAAVATGLFVSEPPTVSEMLAGETPPLSEFAPVLAIVLLSWIDAYRLAVANNAAVRTREASSATNAAGTTAAADATTGDATTTDPTDRDRCPSCGREVDDDLDFCQWCSEPLDADAERSGGAG